MPAEGAWQAFDQHGAPVAACRIQTDVADHDTTGGVLAKVEEAVEIAMMGVATRIVKAGSGEALEACLMEQLGDNWIGTEIVRTIDEKLK